MNNINKFFACSAAIITLLTAAPLDLAANNENGCNTDEYPNNEEYGTEDYESDSYNNLQEQWEKTEFVPVGSKLNIEAFYNKIDTKMDISKLSLSDLRLLRNGFAARQGYCFMDYGLRSIYNNTSWYERLMTDRIMYEGVTDDPHAPKIKPITYTKEETEFINKIKAREAELRKNNYKGREGDIVNTANIINGYQLTEISKPLYDRLGKYGFAIVPRTNIQLFHCYENNDYHDFPSFITTDMHLQLFHIFFSKLLNDVEQNKLVPLLNKFAGGMYEQMTAISDKRLKDAADYGSAYFAICSKLTGNTTVNVRQDLKATVDEETRKVINAEDAFSPFLGYENVEFAYSMFKPRGAYSRTKAMKQYFRAMMWLQFTSCCIENKTELARTILVADIMRSNPQLEKMLRQISAPLNFLVGQCDGLSVFDVIDVLKSYTGSAADIISNNAAMKNIAAALTEKSGQMTRIAPKIKVTCADKIWILPQRYFYDAEVMLELVDCESATTKRGYPTGLDVMAAFGTEAALRILTDELKVNQQWPKYMDKLNGISAKLPQLTKEQTVYNRWMESLAALAGAKSTETADYADYKYPYFMNTAQWDKKNLNTALASWAELKHDVLLYAKQPFLAECGGMIPDPIVVGYVEPNIAYWTKALELTKDTKKLLEQNGLMTVYAKKMINQLIEKNEFLLAISKKELTGQKLTEAEFYSIEKMGSTYEYLTIQAMKAEHGTTWADINGTDKKIPVVADIFTSNAPNNPEAGILNAAIGFADDIYVVVEINGMLHLARGSVFSYREFKTPPELRLTDEEWQKRIETEPRTGVPEWMDEIIIKEEVPADNELIFYDSGC